MANKRIKKKQEKRALQKQINARQESSLKPRKVNQLSVKQLNAIIADLEYKDNEVTKAKARKAKADNHQRKLRHLLDNGIDITGLRYRDIEQVRMSDVKSGLFSKALYPQFYGLETFDFNRVYKLKDGHRLYIAYQDFTTETSLQQIIDEFDGRTVHQLLEDLKYIVILEPSYVRHKSQSSGKAGTAIFAWGQKAILAEQFNRVASTNRKVNQAFKKGKGSRVKNHSGSYKGYQRMMNGSSTTFDKVTPYNLLVVINALMHNCIEEARANLYYEFKTFIEYHIPDMEEYIP